MCLPGTHIFDASTLPITPSSTCYGLIIGEICPNKYKFTGVAAVVVPNVIATGFGAYIAQALVHERSWRLGTMSL